MAKILVIDDDSALRRVTNRILVGAHHQVVEAVDGIDGIEQYRKEKPDIVITDILMPEQEGIATIREIRAVGAKVGIIAISGAGVDGGRMYLKMARHLGADEVLLKPFSPAELLAVLDKVLSRDSLAG